MSRYDPIALGIQWDRLISIADEIVNALVRTSFSTNVRESYDLSCVAVRRARPLDRAGHLQRAVVHRHGAGDARATCCSAFRPRRSARRRRRHQRPVDRHRPLFDINVMQPVFRGGGSSATR